ncbi:dienelactone hydrolase family protein [Bdellovibrio sp. HCB290]|uniref:dienelactone hydrolase family protein n=1 Tax=Bdellovibrio sp. HCB290 TaxID=3394356 RepID=UPI0039B38551
MLKAILSSVVVFMAMASSEAAIKTENVDYKEGKTALEGFVAYDDSVKTPRPAVLIIHQWMGLSDNEKMRAQMLAEKGYVAFAVDIYGKGVRPTSMEEAGKLAGQYKNDRKLYRARGQAAFDWLKKNKMVDAKHIVVIGYCFGGTGALELGRAGVPAAGFVSFHGGLSNPTPADAKNFKAPVLIAHGALDKGVNPEVMPFMREMDENKVDYQFVSYSGAVHAFTQKGAGNDPSKGVAYNEKADHRSWAHFMDFLSEVAPIKK